jgi:hypothetical protein
MDTFSIRRGDALPVSVTLTDDQGDPITTYAGTETLSATVWPGGDLAQSFAPAVAWVNAPEGMLKVGCSAAQTAGLAEGRYFGSVAILDPVLGLLEAYRFQLDVLEAAVTATAPPAYCAFSDLLEYGRAWLRTLQTSDDDAGFSKQCGRARSWLDDQIVASWKGYRNRGVDPDGYGPPLGGIYPSNYPSIWLRQQLDAGGLVLRDIVVEIAAKKALGFICEGQIGSTSNTFDFNKLGNYYRREAESLVKCLRAEINADSNGYPQFVVVCGAMDMR